MFYLLKYLWNNPNDLRILWKKLLLVREFFLRKVCKMNLEKSDHGTNSLETQYINTLINMEQWNAFFYKKLFLVLVKRLVDRLTQFSKMDLQYMYVNLTTYLYISIPFSQPFSAFPLTRRCFKGTPRKTDNCYYEA